jgi:Ca-activated chloride channel homolog
MTAIVNKLRRSFSVSLSLLAASLVSSGGLLPAVSQGLPPVNFGPGVGKRITGAISTTVDGSGTLGAMHGGEMIGRCPLKHTDVKAQISGYVARVTVKQTFQNTFKKKIEAVYTFPLPENAAVDEMTMRIGDRVVKGEIKKKEEAREIYEAAKASGHIASLLDQERPNIFTQSVANIEPGAEIEIEIKYVDMLPYDSGSFTFNFPTVVGPRFMPGKPQGYSGTGRVRDTDEVPDASKISPPVAAAGERAGHDISISVDIAAGVPIADVRSKLHDVKISPESDGAHVVLSSKDKIPNKDFVLTWNVAKDSLQSGYLTHKDSKSGYFTLMLLPPKRVKPENVAPKEMIFLIDTSGSQRGRPLEKAKETMEYIVDHMNANDTFQVLAFNSGVTQFNDTPQKASPEMRAKAKAWLEGLQANGGTWMGPAVEKVCAIPPDGNRLRVVVFMTDGYVGNDFEIRNLVRKHRGTSRWFPFGTGNSVNRFLIDGIAQDGGGEAEYVLLNSPGPVVGEKFYKRISSPVLTDVKLQFNNLSVKEVYPVEISDVWAEKPLYFKGRYLKPGAGTISLTGFSAGKPYKQDLKVVFPEKQDGNAVIKSIWARAKVDRLMAEDWGGAQTGSVNKELKDEIVQTALDYHLMTQYTSFVAVEHKIVTKGGKAETVPVNVEQPDGVSRETTVGEGDVGSVNYNKPVQAKKGRRVPAALMNRQSTSYIDTMGTGSVFIGPSSGRANGAGAGGSTAPQGYRGHQHYGHYAPGGFGSGPPRAAAPAAGYGGYSTAYGAGSSFGAARAGWNGTALGGSVGSASSLALRKGLASGSGSGGGGLPPTSMGKFVHQAGDNQYSTSTQLERHGYSSADKEKARVSESPSISDFSLPKDSPKAAEPAREKSALQEESGQKQKEDKKAESSKLDSLLRQLVSVGASRAGEVAGLDLVDGKVAVKVTLSNTSDKILTKLKEAGFVLISKKDKSVVGRIAVADLQKLCDIVDVIRIAASAAS